MVTRRRWRLAALAALAGGCGPTNAEVGVSVLIAAPVAFLAIVGPPLLLRRLREGPRERPPDDLKLALIGLGVSCLFSVLGFARASEGDNELALSAAAVIGSAGMFYGQLAWLAFDRHQERFGRFALPTFLATTALPATLFALQDPLGIPLSRDAGQTFALFVWALPGYFFVPPLVLFAIAAAVLAHNRRQAERLGG